MDKSLNIARVFMEEWRNPSYQPKFLANFCENIFLRMSQFSSKYCSQVSISEVYLKRPKSFWQLKIKLNKIFDPAVHILFTPFTPKQGYISPNMDNRSSVPSISWEVLEWVHCYKSIDDLSNSFIEKEFSMV